MIEIQYCQLVSDQASSTPIFELSGNTDAAEFQCRVEILLTDADLDLEEDVEYEHLSGVDVGPGTEDWEELIHEITQTEEYQDTLKERNHAGFGFAILE
jgi:hypothetical protein